MYKDTENTKARAREFACDVGITAEIAEIFTSRIPDVPKSKSSNHKEDNYLKILHILDQIANLKGTLNGNLVLDSFAKSLEADFPDARNTPKFQRFAVFEVALTMRFPHEVNKYELSDAEVYALYSWLSSR